MCPGSRIQFDYIGQLLQIVKENKHLLVIVDSFTKWVEAIPTKNNSANTTVQILTEQVFSRCGVPERVDSGQGISFTGSMMKNAMKICGIDQRFNLSYHPHVSKQVERMNRTIKEALKKMVKKSGKE